MADPGIPPLATDAAVVRMETHLTVIGVLFLFLSIPFGTAFGIYTLWALTKPEATRILAPTT